MKNLFPALFCLLATSTAIVAQAAGVAAAEASAPAAKAGPVEKRSFPIQFVGRQLTSGGTLLRGLAASLTENLGCLEYSPKTGLLVAEDTTEALDKIATQLRICDVKPEEVFLEIRVVRLADPKIVERALEGTGQSCEKGLAMLDSTHVTAVLRRLKQEPVRITQAPQLVAIANEMASIFVGTKNPAVGQPDGSWVAPLDADSFDICVLPTIVTGTQQVRLDLQMRSQFTAADGGVVCQPMVVPPGKTVVFQKFAAADRGALVMVTPTILRESTPMK